MSIKLFWSVVYSSFKAYSIISVPVWVIWLKYILIWWHVFVVILSVEINRVRRAELNRLGLKDGTRNPTNRQMLYFKIGSTKESEDPTHLIGKPIIIKHIPFDKTPWAASNKVVFTCSTHYGANRHVKHSLKDSSQNF
jgi:hypothetical protein